MVGLRVALCPLIFLGARLHWAGLWLALIVLVALSSVWGVDGGSIRSIP
jgi:hypothetical protein